MAFGGAMAEGIGVLDGECEGWAVYQEWVGGGWVLIGWREPQILNKSVPVSRSPFPERTASFRSWGPGFTTCESALHECVGPILYRALSGISSCVVAGTACLHHPKESGLFERTRNGDRSLPPGGFARLRQHSS